MLDAFYNISMLLVDFGDDLNILIVSTFWLFRLPNATTCISLAGAPNPLQHPRHTPQTQKMAQTQVFKSFYNVSMLLVDFGDDLKFLIFPTFCLPRLPNATTCTVLTGAPSNPTQPLRRTTDTQKDV